jgi:hypothetical protein
MRQGSLVTAGHILILWPEYYLGRSADRGAAQDAVFSSLLLLPPCTLSQWRDELLPVTVTVTATFSGGMNIAGCWH